MRRSVSWQFLLYSLAVILVAITAVGMVTLLLVDANFSKQEEQYLVDRGDHLVEPLQSAFQWGGDPAELQGIASFGLMTGHARVRILDTHGHLLADSGSYEQLFDPGSFGQVKSPGPAFQLFLDESGRFHGFRMTADWPEGMNPYSLARRPWALAEAASVTAESAPQPPIVAVSDAAISLPLRVDSQVVGYAELSEGPAFGQAIRQTLQQALLIGGLVALLVAAVAAIVAARQVTRPLQSLETAADEMAQGNLLARAEGSQLAEIDRLANQFNSMADQLATTIASLEAERAALRRFIADASHELRTPLTALKTFNALLAGDSREQSGQQAELIEESGRQLDHLDRLTTDLLDLSRLEARLSGTDLLARDIRPVVGEAVAGLRSLSDSKNQLMEVSLPEGPVIVSHDPGALERAVRNLVSNAVRYTPEGGFIQVSLAVEGQWALIHVQDEGPGIPKEEQPHIFGRFYRGRASNGEGNGLGLAIVGEIAAIHNGEITFTSREGEGSHFILRLPLVGD